MQKYYYTGNSKKVFLCLPSKTIDIKKLGNILNHLHLFDVFFVIDNNFNENELRKPESYKELVEILSNDGFVETEGKGSASAWLDKILKCLINIDLNKDYDFNEIYTKIIIADKLSSEKIQLKYNKDKFLEFLGYNNPENNSFKNSIKSCFDNYHSWQHSIKGNFPNKNKIHPCQIEKLYENLLNRELFFYITEDSNKVEISNRVTHPDCHKWDIYAEEVCKCLNTICNNINNVALQEILYYYNSKLVDNFIGDALIPQYRISYDLLKDSKDTGCICIIRKKLHYTKYSLAFINSMFKSIISEENKEKLTNMVYKYYCEYIEFDFNGYIHKSAS